MLQVKLVTSAGNRAGEHEDEDDDVLHGTRVLKELVAPWFLTHKESYVQIRISLL
jgi:hypothetical protein